MATPTLDLRAAAARLVADRVTQGLPEHVTDPRALARIAGILLDVRAERAEAQSNKKASA